MMKPVIDQRHAGLPHPFMPRHAQYKPMIPQRVEVRAPPAPLQPAYIQNLAYHVQPNIPQQPLYSQRVQTVPVQGYIPQYQPVYVQPPPIAQQIAPYFNQYIHPVPVYPYANTHPQMELNHNFDYQAANFLTDTTIVQNSVFCVICGHNFKASEKDQHLKKHMRKSDNSTILLDIPTKSNIESKVGSKKQYITKPLVQPEQHTIQYEPLVYEIVQEVLYEDKPPAPTKDEAIGNQASFSFDQNISFDQRSIYRIPDKLKTEANPFASRGSGQYPGNTLNEPVPFMNYDPNLRNSTNQPNNKIGESVLSNPQNVTSPPNQNNVSKVSQGSQPDNYQLKVSGPKKK